MWLATQGVKMLMRRALLKTAAVRPFVYACRSLTCKALVYSATGRPSEEVKLVPDYPVAELGSCDVSVDMLMCPINPADINTIQGVYAIKPSLPAVGGGEGVGVVTRVGSEVHSFQEGDWVIPASPGIGTWRTTLVADSKRFIKVSDKMPLPLAATLSVNPTTAYRMLKAFVTLKPGDCVIQNGANSGVGQSVIQLAAAWGIKTINIIRDRKDPSGLISYLKDLGGTEVITESVSASFGAMPEILKAHGRPVLGLNTVGGRSTSNLIKHLAPESTVVTYGGMSMKPLTIGTGSFIFKDLKFVGYWNSKWLETNARGEEHLSMIAELCRLAEDGRFRAPTSTEYPLVEGQFQLALEKSMEPYVGAKQLFNMKL